MAAVALLCGTSAIAQTTGGTGSGTGSSMGGQSGSSSSQQPGGSPGSMGTMPEQQGTMGGEPGQSGTMGGEAGQSGTMGGEAGQSGTMGQEGQSGTMGGQESESGTMGSQQDRSAMQGQMSENFAAFDQDKDGALDRTEFARALQVQSASPAAGGESRAATGQLPKGDRAISPLNRSSMEFQRADTNGDGKVSPEEFSNFSPEQQ
ncbi:EF-hand domain-containing protein [Pedomonas sp. V897]